MLLRIKVIGTLFADTDDTERDYEIQLPIDVQGDNLTSFANHLLAWFPEKYTSVSHLQVSGMHPVKQH